MVHLADNDQDAYFYGLEWTKPITLSLIAFLVNQKSIGNWLWNASNGRVIKMAREHLNTSFNTSYTEGQVAGRVKSLRNRFNLFDHMISCSGVGWDHEENKLDAPLEQWTEWRKVYPRCVAYISHGEPLYEDLKKLFPPELILEEEDQIIIVSDSDEDLPPPAADGIENNQPNDVDNVEVVQLSDGDVGEDEEDVEVIELSDDEEDLNDDDMLYLSDFEDIDYPLEYTEEPTEEVIDVVDNKAHCDDDDEVISPMSKHSSIVSFSGLLPRYIPNPPSLVGPVGDPSVPFDPSEMGNSGSSSEKPITLKSRSLFK